ncbi:MAG: hypothetical protein QXW91_04880 [Candidatus Nitrosotenuis sp.]
MKSKLFISFGMVLLLSGIIFHLQGSGRVGPESSFMYDNSDWIDYGLWIAISGVIAIATGALMSRRKS